MNCQRVDRVGCFHAIFLCCLCLAMVKSEHSSIMLSMTQVSLLRAGSLSHTHTHLIMLHKWAKSFKGNLRHFSETIIISLSHFRIKFFGTFPFCNGKPINFTLIVQFGNALNISPPTPLPLCEFWHFPVNSCHVVSDSIAFCCCPNIDY